MGRCYDEVHALTRKREVRLITSANGEYLGEKRHVTVILRLVLDHRGTLQVGELSDLDGAVLGRFSAWGDLTRTLARWLAGLEHAGASLTGMPPLSQVVADMLATLGAYLPPQIPPSPAPSVSLLSATPQAVGLGNWRGNEVRGALPILALKGGHLDAVVRFQLWANDLAGADGAVKNLQGSLLAATTALRDAGFLRLAAEDESLAEQPAGIGAWRETANYRVLYEYQYQDTDGADSVIARIPINIDSNLNDATVVTDQIVRWDNQGALPLELTGGGSPTTVGGLSILAFLPPGWSGGAVTVKASIGGAVTQWTSASLMAFLTTFTLDAGSVDLGGNPYLSGQLSFPNLHLPVPITLAEANDMFRVEYATLALGFNAVVYLRALK
jgi:hypothetical protein